MQYYELMGKGWKSPRTFTIEQNFKLAEKKGIKLNKWDLKRHLLVGTRNIDVLLDKDNKSYEWRRERLNTDKYKLHLKVLADKKRMKDRNFYDKYSRLALSTI